MIQIERLRKTYRSGFKRKPCEAVRDVSLKVGSGEVFGLVGPNGAGKSTLIKMMLGLLNPTAGLARLFGIECRNPAARKSVGYLPESPCYPAYLTGQEFLRYYAGLSELAPRQIPDEIESCRAKAGFEKAWLSVRLGAYSKGMLQRIGLAQCLLGKPDLLILDEPTSGLDPLGRRDFINLIKNLKKEGASVFYSSHILGDVGQLCDTVGVLAGGVLKTVVSVDEVRQQGMDLEAVLLKEFG